MLRRVSLRIDGPTPSLLAREGKEGARLALARRKRVQYRQEEYRNSLLRRLPCSCCSLQEASALHRPASSFTASGAASGGASSAALAKIRFFGSLVTDLTLNGAQFSPAFCFYCCKCAPRAGDEYKRVSGSEGLSYKP